MLKNALIAAAVLVAFNNGSWAGETKGHASHAGQSHAHDLLEVDASEAPHITELTIAEDAKSGFNLFLTTENFQFAPEQVNLPHVAGKGHAHIFVDGIKITRLYGPAYYLDGLTYGEHRIEVRLNANDHREYAVNGRRVVAEKYVTVR